MRSFLTQLFDAREGELRLVLQAFATLFLVIAGHTTLETARDAIFLQKLPPSELNIVYVVLAGVTLVTTAASTALASRFGRRNALIASLVAAAYVTTVFYFLTMTPRVALALYVFSGLLGAMLTPQFWMLAAQLFTVSQGRRLFGPIASGGVLGAIAGAATAAMLLRTSSVASLMPVAAALFALTALLLTGVEVGVEPVSTPRPSLTERAPAASPPTSIPPPAVSRGPDPHAAAGARKTRRALFVENPYLAYVAGLVVLSTAAVLTIDYLFKATAARMVPAASLGEFFARYYAVMNGLSLIVQVALAGRLVRRAGVLGAVAVTPFLLFAGGLSAIFGGGIFFVVLALKGIDGSLRYSLNRVATELLYLPLPADVRDRGKGFIDSVLARAAQAVMAVVLYALAMHHLAHAHLLALLVAVLSAGWLAIALGIRRAYLDLFRRALAAGHIGPETEIPELDLPSAEALVESMASPDPVTVTASMEVLVQHRRAKLIPALILYHDSPDVVVRALEILSASARTDWTPLAIKLLSHASEEVRIAAVRALARKGRTEALERATSDPSTRVHAYAAFHLARREAGDDLAEHPLVAVIMKLPGIFGDESRRGLLDAITDAPDERATTLLLALAERPEIADDEGAMEQIARAMTTLKSPRFVPLGVGRLAKRVGRDAMRDALVATGEPALEALENALRDEHAERRIRLHAPQTLARFRSQRVADFLLERLESEPDGFVRFKVLRALGQLVAGTDVRTSRRRVETQALRNLEEYLRMLSFRAALGRGKPSTDDDAGSLLRGLIDDKVSQALARAFRLLKIAHKREDIHRAHRAALSNEPRERANAGEFLDALLARRDQQPLREILRVVVDEASDAERVARASSLMSVHVRTEEEALAVLIDDRDETLAALAACHAVGLGVPGLREAVAQARARRPSLTATTAHLFGPPALVLGGAHG
jgi:AAA family ATP:ADP antiporter